MGQGLARYRDFNITHRHTTLGVTPLDEGSARLRDLCLTAHNTHKKQTSVSPAGLEPTTLGPQTQAFYREVTRIGHVVKINTVKQSHYRPGQAQRVLTKVRFPDFRDNGTGWW